MQHAPHNFHFLLHSANLVEERLRQRLLSLGVPPRQARILDALDRMGTTSQIELAREFNVTAASMSTMTARLIAADLISRRVDPVHQRSNVLELTEKGQSLVDAVREAWSDVDRLIEELIGPDNARRLAELTYDLRDALGGRTPGGETKD